MIGQGRRKRLSPAVGTGLGRPRSLAVGFVVVVAGGIIWFRPKLAREKLLPDAYLLYRQEYQRRLPVTKNG